MTYALYLDPSKKNAALPELPDANPRVAYWRLIDLSSQQLMEFVPSDYPEAQNTIVEIHPAQLEMLQFPVNRLSIVQQKSAFRNLSQLRGLLENVQCDITYIWDHRFNANYYTKMLQYWIQMGITHFSFYELTKFDQWQRVKQFLADNGFYFYDRYHACKPGQESVYQKHLAGFGDLYAMGGFSRVTENGITRIKGPADKQWETLSPNDRIEEKLLFALADRDGVALDGLNQRGIDAAVKGGYAVVQGNRLIPTDTGLWDTVGLASQLHQ